MDPRDKKEVPYSLVGGLGDHYGSRVMMSSEEVAEGQMENSPQHVTPSETGDDVPQPTLKRQGKKRACQVLSDDESYEPNAASASVDRSLDVIRESGGDHARHVQRVIDESPAKLKALSYVRDSVNILAGNNPNWRDDYMLRNEMEDMWISIVCPTKSACAKVSGASGGITIITVTQVAFELGERLNELQVVSVEALMGDGYYRRYNMRPPTMDDKACYTDTDRDLMERAIVFVAGRSATRRCGMTAGLVASMNEALTPVNKTHKKLGVAKAKAKTCVKHQ